MVFQNSFSLVLKSHRIPIIPGVTPSQGFVNPGKITAYNSRNIKVDFVYLIYSLIDDGPQPMRKL